MVPENGLLIAVLALATVCLLASVIVLLEPHRHPRRSWRNNNVKID